jgi:hypothetical protein
VKERLELVTSFASLRAADLVEVRGCRYCGRTHRYMLLSQVAAHESECGDCRGWRSGAHPGRSHICAGSVASRRVYKVDTGLEASDSSTTHRTLPRKQPARTR